MSASFGSAAVRLFGLAARLLGWRPFDFWSATPAELVAALSATTGRRDGIARDELEKLMEKDNGHI